MPTPEKHFAHDARLNSRVDVLEHSVGEVKSFLTEFAKEVRTYIQQQQAAPRPIPFREIIATMAVTLGLVYGILDFIDKRSDASIAVYKYRIEQLEKNTGSTLRP